MDIAIIDGNLQDVDKIKGYLNKYGREKGITFNINSFKDGVLFLLNYRQFYDIVIINIAVGTDGFKTAQKLRQSDSKTALILYSDVVEDAINGYKVSACDFAIKPLSYVKFCDKMSSALRWLDNRPDDIISIKGISELVRTSAYNIYYVEVMKHYLIYHTVNRSVTARGTMAEAEENLRPYRFFRIHHSYLVNLNHVKSVNGDIVTVAETKIKVSRTRKKDFLSELI